MKDYRVVFKDRRVGRNRSVDPVTFEKVEDLDQLRARLHKHVGQFLRSRDVSVEVNSITRHGSIYAGMRRVGEFDWTVTRVHGTGKPKPIDGEVTMVASDFARADHHHGTAGLHENVVRCSWDSTTDNHCTEGSSGLYWLWGIKRELCEMHGRRSDGRVDEPELSPDRPCDWILGTGVCGKPSANVRWGTSVLRWHCPEHSLEAPKCGWKPVEKVST